MKSRERAIAYLREYMKRNFSGYNGLINSASFLGRIGLTDTEFENLLLGDMLLDEPRFYKLLEICRDYDYSGMRGKYQDWYIETPNWKLIGFVEHTITLEKVSGERISEIQGIIRGSTVIIDNPEINIDEGDILLHKYGKESVERLTVDRVDSYRYETRKPAYVLTVRRCNAVMGKKTLNNNINVYGNVNNIAQGDNASVVDTPKDKGMIEKIVPCLCGLCDWFLEKIKS